MAQSTVFEAMILSDLQEAQDGKVIIEKIRFEVMQQVVDYMHFGVLKAKNFSLVLEVLMAADRYDVQDLKEECLDHITSSLTKETAAEGLVMAVKHLTPLVNNCKKLLEH